MNYCEACKTIHYYEVYIITDSGDPLEPDGIDLKGSCEVVAFDTLEEALDFASENNATIISEFGGNWEEWEKCTFCGDWFPSTELNSRGECWSCERVIRDHGGY